MKNSSSPVRKLLSLALLVLFSLMAYSATAGIYYWDPHGTTGGNPDLGDLTGTWETSMWSTTNAGLATPIAWVENNAACFGIGTGFGTPAFTVTMNNNHTVAGMFIGALAPNSCDVTVTGNGVITIPSGLQGFNIANSTDGSVGLLRINNVIAGTGSPTAEGNGQIFLNATNTYSGGTFLGYSGASFRGIINFNNTGSFGTGSIVVSNTSSAVCALVASVTSPITITNKITWSPASAGLNLVGNPAGVTFSGPLTMAAVATNANIGAGGDDTDNLVILSGVISGGNANGNLTKFNAATLRLSGANTYLPNTVISDGVLQLGNNSAIPSGANKGNVSVVYPSILDINGFSGSINGLSGLGSIINSTGTGTLTFGNNNASSQYDGTISSDTNRLNITKAGTGTIALTGVNTYLGNTTVNGGVLQMMNTLPANSPVSIASGATLDVNYNSFTMINLAGRGNISNNVGTITVSGDFSAGSTLTTYSCFSGSIDNGSLVKGGTQAMALRGTNNLIGGTAIYAGTLSVGAAPDRLPATAPLAIADGATFQLDANSQTVASLSGSGFINLGGGTLTVSNADTSSYSGVIQNSELAGSSTALGHGLRGYYYGHQDMTSLLAVRDDANINFTDLTSPTQLPAALYPNTNNISVRWLGQVLTTAGGTYSFTVTSDDGSRLWVNGVALVDSWITQGATARSGSLTLAANTRYDIVVEYFNQASGSSAKLLWTPPGDAAASIIPTDYLFLPGAGSLVKDGTGSLTLTAANTYSGTTVVKAGTLEAGADSALGNGNVVVLDGAVLTLDNGSTNGYISGSADLLLSTTFPLVNLNFTGTDTIHALSFDGGATYQPTGSYGAIGSGATFESSKFSGSGFLFVTAVPSTTTLTSSTNTLQYGNSVTFTATVAGSGPTPTGSVTFYDGTSAIGVSLLDGSGVATLTVSNLSVFASPHSITAVYGGDATYVQSTSAAVSETVTPITIAPGAFTASNRVYNGTNTATIATTAVVGLLSNDTNSVRIIPATASTGAFFADRNVGTNKLVTVTNLTLAGGFAGNYILSPSNTTATANITAKALTVTGITASNRVYNGTATFNVNVSAAAITGVISPDDVTLVTSGAFGTGTNVNVSTGKTVTINGLTLSGADSGNYTITAPTTTANITQASTANTVASSSNPSTSGASVTFGATLSAVAPGAGTPTGNVIFLINGAAFSTNASSSGVASSISTTSLAVGTNVITARYAGDSNFIGKTNTLQQVVNAPIAAPALSISALGTNIVLQWSGVFTLQSTPSLSATWQDIPSATSPYTNTAPDNQTFFRLRN